MKNLATWINANVQEVNGEFLSIDEVAEVTGMTAWKERQMLQRAIRFAFGSKMQQCFEQRKKGWKNLMVQK